MKLLELAVTERNRLTRFCFVLNILSLILAMWARDPLLDIGTPFSWGDTGNITVGHVILIGQPIIAILFLVFVAQIYRYSNVISQLSTNERGLIDWRFRTGTSEYALRRFVRYVGEFFRWLAMIAIPAVSSGMLLFSQFDFKACDETTRQEIKFSISEMFNPAFSGDRDSVSFRELESLDCKGCSGGNDSKKKEEDKDRGKIGSGLPKLYQPWNFIVGAFMQILVIAAFLFVSVDYFRAPRKRE